MWNVTRQRIITEQRDGENINNLIYNYASIRTMELRFGNTFLGNGYFSNRRLFAKQGVYRTAGSDFDCHHCWRFYWNKNP